ncbi:MAG: Gfo/Idh/MocA family oxidoreductase [Planctomycetes bacterium]|nr:Gfo/Idh/MocA family oxidoreductase [Planctomycetota bacterium]
MSRIELSRRDVMRGSIAAGAAFSILGATAKGQGKAFRVGIIGCGGRGSGAIAQHVEAAKVLNDTLNLGIEMQVVACADFFKERAEGTGKRFGVPPERCFGGADNYKRLLEVPLDNVVMAQAPAFRPPHFAACIKAGKHVFMEKPSAVDAPGVRMVIEAGKLAREKGLVVVAGTQRRHEQGYNQRYQLIKEGAVGKVLAGRVAWNMGKIFHNTPMNPTKPEDLVRGGNWQLWIELSGDHIVEQHVHNLDIANWFVGRHPVSAAAFGGRARRKAGNMYDFFSGDVDYGDNVHIHSMCRQVGGCWDWVGESFVYEKPAPAGYKFQEPVRYSDIPQKGGAYVQEHINMLYHILKGKELNEAQSVAESTGVAIMVRDSAYTGKMMKWNEMFDDPKANPEIYNRACKPSWVDFEEGNIAYPKDGDAPVPGTA